MPRYQYLYTDRLILRPTDIEDASFICVMQNDPGWLRYIGDRGVRSISDATDYIVREMLPRLHQYGFSNYTMVRKDDQMPIGVCGFYDRPEIEGFDLGYALLEDFTGQGYAGEAAAELVRAAFIIFQLKELSAVVDADNRPSIKLIAKLGFKYSESITMNNKKGELYHMCANDYYGRDKSL